MDDIAIIDLDLKKTTWSRVHSSMRTLYLKLSAEPDLDWVRFFREERESRVVVKRHGLWIEDGYIVFDCLLADVETHHLPDFRRSLAYANGKCRDLKATRRKESHKRRTDAHAEQQALAHLRAQIRGSEERLPPARSAPVAAARPASAATGEDARFDAKRNELRARFRAALKSRTRKPDRGND
jgi:hypothetical protein